MEYRSAGGIDILLNFNSLIGFVELDSDLTYRVLAQLKAYAHSYLPVGKSNLESAPAK
jgi:hypothetical protein